MKKLSDYKGDAAIELWMDLMDPLSVIIGDERIAKIVQLKKPRTVIAKEVLKLHKKEAVEILKRIDPEPIDGLNLVLRLLSILTDIGQNEEIQSFFGYAEQAKTASESSGSVTGNIGGEEN